jgi:hypothetical protein
MQRDLVPATAQNLLESGVTGNIQVVLHGLTRDGVRSYKLKTSYRGTTPIGFTAYAQFFSLFKVIHS